ncbi:MAG: methyltransferase domain-containing protein [Burkholderiales bacterium]|nr:methyltransferase domain-containing protein [Burkholderiales bacterium]
MIAWLTHPAVYRWSQALLAPGAATVLENAIGQRIQASGALAACRRAGRRARVLDVGCGPRSMLAGWCGQTPGRGPQFEVVGVDLSLPHVRAFRAGVGAAGVVASACCLPFADGSFDIVLSCGLLHHLGDDEAARALAEMHRVGAPGSELVVLDAVLPLQPWRRPLAHAIRRLDRGRHMRSEAALRALLERAGRTDGKDGKDGKQGVEGTEGTEGTEGAGQAMRAQGTVAGAGGCWHAERFTYARTGLEGLLATRRLAAPTTPTALTSLAAQTAQSAPSALRALRAPVAAPAAPQAR